MIRVLIVDDQMVVCEGLQAILGTVPDIEVLGVSNNGEEAAGRWSSASSQTWC